MNHFAYVTALTSLDYLPGVFALKYALEDVGSVYPLVVLIPDGMRASFGDALQNLGVEVLAVPEIVLPRQPEHLNSYWSRTFIKLRSAGLVQYSKIVLLDSDMLILKNLDHLFEKPSLSAVVDGAPFLRETHLNSGIMVIEPSEELEANWIQQVIPTLESRSLKNLGTGDQDVIRDAHPAWPEQKELHLPPQYNTFLRDVDAQCAILPEGYDGLYVVHFIGPLKPWNYTFRKWLSHIKRYVLPRKKCALRAFNAYRKILSKYS